MIEKLKKAFAEDRDLEDRIFNVILDMGVVIVTLSAIVTCFENLSVFATVTSLIGAFLFLLTFFTNYHLGKQKLARLMLCYLANCFLIPVVFFTCGGIDSGMPLYIIGGLFLIMPTLKGRERNICLIISLLVHICTVGFSYCFMENNKAAYDFGDTNILAKLTLEARIIDMIASVVLVSVFICITTGLILAAYRRERDNKEKLLKRLDDLSRKDELTGLYNRRELFWHLDTMERFWQKGYYIAMFDIDHFKKINDTYGHLFGDQALRVIAAKLNELVEGKQDEIAARYGGEEFVVLLRAEDDETAFAKTDGVRKQIEELSWEGYEDLTITISGGLLSCSGYTQIETMMSDVDVKLYEAKHSGRNRICLAGAEK